MGHQYTVCVAITTKNCTAVSFEASSNIATEQSYRSTILSDDGGGSLQQDVSQSAVSPYPDPSPSNGASVMPSMPDVHRSVNTIRYFVYSADYDQDTKRELLQGLDDIYIKLGEANKRTEFATNHKIERT